MFFDQIGIKAIVAGGHRSMSSEDHLARNGRHGGVEANAFIVHAHVDRFQHRESAVPFVQMKNARRDTHGSEGAGASNAKHQLLPDASARVSAIEAGSQFAVVGSVAFDIRTEEEQVTASNFPPPDFGVD